MEVVLIEQENDNKSTIDKNMLKSEIDLLNIADNFIDKNPLYFDKARLWWSWNKNDNAWHIIDETDLLNDLSSCFESGGLLNATLRNQFFTALEMTARRKEPKEAPVSWLQFKNCVYDINTGERIKPSPDYFLTTPIPHNLGDDDNTPMVDQLLSDWNDDKKELLLEIMAYCLLRDYPIQRIFVFLGSGCNGKGSFLRLIRRIIGNDNCVNTELERLSNPNNRFESIKIFNKLAIFMGELNFSMISKTSIIKQYTGGDLITAEIKNKGTLNFTNFAKMLISTNTLPITFDKTDGYFRRFMIIRFMNKFDDGREITDGVTEEEIECLCLKLARTLKNLYNNGKFTNEETLDERRFNYERLSNPMIEFIDNNYIINPSSFVVKNEFVDGYKRFLTDNGYRLMSNKEISSSLRIMGYEEAKRKVDGSEYSIPVILGLSVGSVVDNALNVEQGASKPQSKQSRESKQLLLPENTYIGEVEPAYFSYFPCSDEFSLNTFRSILDLLRSNVTTEQELIEWLVANNLGDEQHIKGCLHKLCHEGVVAEVKAGVYKLVNGGLSE